VLAATPARARELLARGAMVVCFPEGSAATAKSYDTRYRLTAFEDELLLQAAFVARAAIVPGAVVGNEESFPVLARIGKLPLTPMFPLGGLFGLLPLPLGWRVQVGIPLVYDPEDRAAAETAAADLGAMLRTRMQAMLGELLAERRSIVRG